MVRVRGALEDIFFSARADSVTRVTRGPQAWRSRKSIILEYKTRDDMSIMIPKKYIQDDTFLTRPYSFSFSKCCFADIAGA